VDRLALFKVLAEPSRYAIYEEVAEASEPLSTFDIASRLELHPSTVRLHLEKMREVGLVEVCSDRHGSIGRPQHLWSAAPGAPALGLEPSGMRVLAHLLAELATRPPGDVATAVDVGRDEGRRRASRERRAGRRHACVEAVLEDLTDLGFDPVLDGAEGPTSLISFNRCPFRELAVLYPDLVCELHRGLTEGIVAAAQAACGCPAARVESFSNLVERDPCRVEVSIGA
jgi:predicted ArsR family transcriptional regulator